MRDNFFAVTRQTGAEPIPAVSGHDGDGERPFKCMSRRHAKFVDNGNAIQVRIDRRVRCEHPDRTEHSNTQPKLQEVASVDMQASRVRLRYVAENPLANTGIAHNPGSLL